MRTAIWWIRRDLRLDDNQALAAALQQGEVVIPFFKSLDFLGVRSETRKGMVGIGNIA